VEENLRLRQLLLAPDQEPNSASLVPFWSIQQSVELFGLIEDYNRRSHATVGCEAATDQGLKRAPPEKYES
jgi:hypothetical protein